MPERCRDNVLSLKLDVSDTHEEVYRDAVESGLKRFGRIDVLVNNAGFGGITNFEETGEETIRKMFEVNLLVLCG